MFLLPEIVQYVICLEYHAEPPENPEPKTNTFFFFRLKESFKKGTLKLLQHTKIEKWKMD